MSTAQEQKIRDAIEEYGFGWKVEELMQAAQPAIRLNAERTDMDSLPIGASRMGGLPDLPPGLAWPDFEGRPLEFLVQINFAETAAAASATAVQISSARFPARFTSGTETPIAAMASPLGACIAAPKL